MKNYLFLLVLTLFALSSCNKEALPIEIYLENETTPLIQNEDILSYNKKAFNFTIKAAAAKKLSIDLNKKFLLKVGNETVFEGQFWPLFLSSLPDGIYIWVNDDATLALRFSDLKTGKIDKRSDDRLITALRNSKRLK